MLESPQVEAEYADDDWLAVRCDSESESCRVVSSLLLLLVLAEFDGERLRPICVNDGGSFSPVFEALSFALSLEWLFDAF